MTFDGISRELVNDCLKRIAEGDPDAAFDFSTAAISHMDARNIAFSLAIVDAFATVSKQQGSTAASEFLSDQWPELKLVLEKRWRRAGFAD